MLHIAKRSLVLSFLARTKGGLIVIYEQDGTAKVGWIEDAVPTEKGVRVRLKMHIVQKPGTSNWNQSESCDFEVPDLDTYTALDSVGGFHCTDSCLQGPTFQIFPASSIPAEYARDHQTLIDYGNVLR